MLKRIAIVAPEFKPEYMLHQPWRQVYEIATRLPTRGVDVAIVTSGIDENEIGGVRIISLAMQHIRKLDSESKSRIASFSPDVIYWIGNTYSGLYMKHNKFDVPVVLHISTLHMLYKELRNLSLSEIIREHRMQLFTAFFPFTQVVSSLNHENIRGIISASRSVTDRLVQLHVKRSKIRTSPLFFQNDLSNNGVEHRNTAAVTVCYAGPADTIRGSMIVMEAVKILKEQGFDIKLLFLLRSRNPQVEKEYFEAIAKEFQISESVNIISGILPRSQLESYINSSDIVAIPTKFVWNEPPLTILEAMQAGKAVVTTNVCGIPGMVSDKAFAVEPSARAFANKIRELIEKNEISKIGLAAKTYVDSLPDWNGLTDWTLAALQEFANNG